MPLFNSHKSVKRKQVWVNKLKPRETHVLLEKNTEQQKHETATKTNTNIHSNGLFDNN